MKAIQISKFVKDLTTLSPEAVLIPNATCPQDLTIRITHAAVTHVDLLYAQGLHQNNRRHVKPPFILGTEFSGIVVASPPNSSFQPGARVFGGGLGAFAEFICAPETSVRRIREQWSNAEACAVGASGAVSYGALMDVGELKSGEWVCVFGASGGLGVMAVQIAKAVGARVIAVVGGEEKTGIVRRIGADVVVDYRNDGWEERVREAAGEGVHVVFDGIGAVESGMKCLRYRGRLVVVGFAARDGDVERIRVNRVLLKGVKVIGYRFGEDGRRDPRTTKDAWDGFMKLVDSGSVQPVIYKEAYRGLEAVPRALEDAKKHKAWGRAVLRINEGPEAEAEGQKSRL